MSDTVIVIPSKRKPPIVTLNSYELPEDMEVIVVTDPEVEALHREFYEKDSKVHIFPGVPGLGANKAMCYNAAFKYGYRYFFRMDDDLLPNTFVGDEPGWWPTLEQAIKAARHCLDTTDTTLAGFFNGTNRYWMGKGCKRTWGLIHGGANMAVSSPDGTQYIDPRLVRAEDVYRTCAHREEREGFVGRIQYIGFDKKGSTVVAGQTSVNATQEQIDESVRIVLDRFPNMVTCNGTREIFGGQFTIANWRMKKGM